MKKLLLVVVAAMMVGAVSAQEWQKTFWVFVSVRMLLT